MNREHVTCMTLVRDTFGWVFTPYQVRRSGAWGAHVQPEGPQAQPWRCLFASCKHAQRTQRAAAITHAVSPWPTLLLPCPPPSQKAVVVVRSYPLFPDCYSIVSCALQQRAPALLEGAPQPKLLPAAPAST